MLEKKSNKPSPASPSAGPSSSANRRTPKQSQKKRMALAPISGDMTDEEVEQLAEQLCNVIDDYDVRGFQYVEAPKPNEARRCKDRRAANGRGVLRSAFPKKVRIAAEVRPFGVSNFVDQ